MDRKKLIVTVAGVGAAIVVAVGAGVLLRTSQQETAAPKERGGLVDTLSKEKSEAQNLALSGKVDEANEYIDSQLAKPDLTDSQRYDLYLQQGVIARNGGKQAEALVSFRKAEEARETREISSLIAEVSITLDDKQTAITYWKKEISQIPKSSPLYDDDKAALEQRIRDAGGSL